MRLLTLLAPAGVVAYTLNTSIHRGATRRVP